LVCAGKRSLDSGKVFDAKRYFAIAYECGMSKDSMLYFAAETYMRSFVLDTAMTYNWGLEKLGNLSADVYLEQRSRIFRMIGWNHQADSILALIRRKDCYDLSVNVSASRSMLTLNPVIIPPKGKSTFNFDEILDDAGDFQINQRLYRYHNSWFRRTYAMFGISSEFVVPTRYSFKNDNDTAIKSITFYLGAGEMPRTPELIIGHRWAIHSGLQIDHFNKVLLSFSMKNDCNLSIGHDFQWRNGQVCDNRADLQFYKIFSLRKLFWMPSMSAAYHFSKVNQYQDDITLYNPYPKLPIGYIDSRSLSDSTTRFYRDPALSQIFDLNSTKFPNIAYWNKQPTMKLFVQPTQDINATVKSSLFLNLPFKTDLNIENNIQCSWYPEKKVIWFTVKNDKDSSKINIENMQKIYAILYNVSDGKYYLTTNRVDPKSIKNNLIELKKHQKTRFDCYLSMTINIEKEIGILGELYFITSYMKCFSTLPENSPLITLNQNWELRAGWKRDISKTW
jgi:hypothetical protein